MRPCFRIRRLAALDSNLIPLLEWPERRQAAVVDPAVAAPVIAALEAGGMELTAVLHTHHHHDHVGGTAALIRRWPGAAVIGNGRDRRRLPPLSHPVADGDSFQLLGRTVTVLEVPAHTSAHVAYFMAGDPGEEQPLPPELFCGDTLFSCGCGRLFEGTAEQLHRALQRFAALPPQTRVWCAHEYTEKNLLFARRHDPHNADLQAYGQRVAQLRRAQLPTIPSRIGLELAVNPFLRSTTPALQAATGQADPVAVLAALRRGRDCF